jgi:hypothetical protein
MVWYDETAIANIFGFTDLKKKHRITFDSEKEDAFIVHMYQNKITRIESFRNWGIEPNASAQHG